MQGASNHDPSIHGTSFPTGDLSKGESKKATYTDAAGESHTVTSPQSPKVARTSSNVGLVASSAVPTTDFTALKPGSGIGEGGHQATQIDPNAPHPDKAEALAGQAHNVATQQLGVADEDEALLGDDFDNFEAVSTVDAARTEHVFTGEHIAALFQFVDDDTKALLAAAPNTSQMHGAAIAKHTNNNLAVERHNFGGADVIHLNGAGVALNVRNLADDPHVCRLNYADDQGKVGAFLYSPKHNAIIPHDGNAASLLANPSAMHSLLNKAHAHHKMHGLPHPTSFIIIGMDANTANKFFSELHDLRPDLNAQKISKQDDQGSEDKRVSSHSSKAHVSQGKVKTHAHDKDKEVDKGKIGIYRETPQDRVREEVRAEARAADAAAADKKKQQEKEWNRVEKENKHTKYDNKRSDEIKES